MTDKIIFAKASAVKLNDETLQAFSDYKNKVGLTKYDNFGNFWKDFKDTKKPGRLINRGRSQASAQI